MKCGLNNSLSSAYFGKKPENNPMKNGQLNFGVVTPPDKLPNGSPFHAFNQAPKEAPKAPKKIETGGGKTFTAGKISAICAFGTMILSAVALLPFIRKH